MKRSEIAKSTSESSQDATAFEITTQQFQNCLDENKNLIEAIMENRRHGQLVESAPYLNQLQNNLLCLTRSAYISEAKNGRASSSNELRELEKMISSDYPTPTTLNKNNNPAAPAMGMGEDFKSSKAPRKG